jgi:hypothetical protein
MHVIPGYLTSLSAYQYPCTVATIADYGNNYDIITYLLVTIPHVLFYYLCEYVFLRLASGSPSTATPRGWIQKKDCNA